ncbi:predicted protein [Arabidopsis lyrata subsp. lyrata]|uniref:Predicted protein n=1 Tax=Arabidopsis lyrata subsp. lyrata TaxID=81972 RepID=D7L1T7_ARALL|nr:protein VARIATION IN COMPOUND TRIGGERED ROOT growth response isoform X1 [Arabidopsis lyrata subsp. lyrata]EFH62180.1 predicted protein [Arabidopsis lyrata subsp. lyrata]|eukprot:XP_002885921.1 protein VARIATION IN COMPOUND TRIGGERED ROOT growth response isoform X1 [Arabidopsis lyrata subsp. lyrata]
MTIISPFLRTLRLSDIPSLVELPSSFQNLYLLKHLTITECINLESLPANISFEYLTWLDLSRCSRLRSFPDISTNISLLDITETGIEEVPWWIQDFSCLRYFYMSGCNNLQCISVNICKLKSLKIANFAHCGALTEARINDSPSEVAVETDSSYSESQVSDESSSSLSDNYIPKLDLNFRNCFNLDPEALLHQQSFFKDIVLPGEEVPTYFTHRTSGNSSSLTNISMPYTYPYQPFFRTRACAVIDYDGIITPGIYIQLSCRFEGRFGNHFNSTYRKDCLWTDQKVSHLFIFDCLFPLNKDNDPMAEVNYDQVDINISLTGGCNLKGWGIRLFEGYETDQSDECGDNDDSDNQGEECEECDSSDDQSEESGDSDNQTVIRLSQDFSSPENRLGNPNTLPHVCEASEDNMLNDGCRETEHVGECRGNNVETERSSKRMRIT